MTLQQPKEGEAQDPRIGMRLGDHVVVSHIADGAMGAVYEARDPDSQTQVALKILHDEVLGDPVAVERFHREYETAELFDHPHIVRVLDAGSTPDGAPYMTMELLRGQELSKLLAQDKRASPARVLRIAAQVADALSYAHSFGVIHRDLKPDNIFLCEPDDEVRILDFGSVKLQVETGPKLTAFGTTLGSPYYMSPEQARGLPDVDPRSDVFALGAIVYEALTGRVAFEGSTVAEILMAIVRGTPPAPRTLVPTLPTALDDVLSKVLHKDRDARYATPTAFVNAALGAFSLPGDVATWKARSTEDIEQALAEASAEINAETSAEASAETSAEINAEASAASTPSRGPAQRSAEPSARPATLEKRSGGGMRAALWLVALGLLVLAGAAVALFSLAR